MKRHVPFLDLSSSYRELEEKLDTAVKNVINSSSFILGPEVEQFEKAFAKFCNARYCVAVDSGISALELGMRALGIGKGNEVITPVNSFIASSSAISFTGATPVWIDADPKTYNLDVSQIEKKITKKTKAIMPVHLYGQPADMDEVLKIAKKHKLFVIEDACQAHGAKYKGKKVGTFSDFAAFSFYPGKNLGAFGDAGAIVTNNKKFYKIVAMMRNYGQSKKYHHDVLAWNRRMDTIQAAVLLTKLPSLEKWNKKRRKNATLYSKLLKNLPVVIPINDVFSEHVYHLYVIRTKKRNALQTYLYEKGIDTGIHYPIPIHLQKAYKHIHKTTYPVTERYAKELLSLPLYPQMTEEDIVYVATQIKNFFTKNA